MANEDHLSRKSAVNYLRKLGCPISIATMDRMAAGEYKHPGPPFVKFPWGTVRYSKLGLYEFAKKVGAPVPAEMPK